MLASDRYRRGNDPQLRAGQFHEALLRGTRPVRERTQHELKGHRAIVLVDVVTAAVTNVAIVGGDLLLRSTSLRTCASMLRPGSPHHVEAHVAIWREDELPD